MRRIDKGIERKTAVSLKRLIKTVLFFAAAAATGQTAMPEARVVAPSQRQILVSLEDRKLALLDGGKVLKIYPVAVGTDSSPSPEGEFTVVNRLENPTYYHSGKAIGPGKQNPLGTRWMGLSQKGYGIHGTNEPKSIGKAASHGCIRMTRRDLEELFTMVRVGDKIKIQGELDEQLAQVFAGGEKQTPSMAANVGDSTATDEGGDN